MPDGSRPWTRGMSLRHPGQWWTDALPVGSGRVGAMLFGHAADECVLLNHEQLFRRSRKPTLPDLSDQMPEVRRLLRNGQRWQATTLHQKAMAEAGYEGRIDPYQPAGSVVGHFTLHGSPTGFRRWLDFERGVAGAHWTVGQTRHERRVFVHRQHHVVVFRHRVQPTGIDPAIGIEAHLRLAGFMADREAGMASMLIAPPASDDVTFEPTTSTDWLTLVGTFPNEGSEVCPQFGAVARVLHVGGDAAVCEATRTRPEGLAINDASEVMLLVGLFAHESAETAIPRLKEQLNELAQQADALEADHAAEHAALFNRVQLELAGGDAGASQLNESLFAQAHDEEALPTALLQRAFDFGRHLFIAATPEQGLPANLQGLWNGDYDPAWSSDFHLDVNLQMCHWAALPGGLPELMEPYFKLIEDSLPDYRENARKIFGCDGVVSTIAQSTYGYSYPGLFQTWSGGCAWLAQLFYDYYLFTGDEAFLRERYLPLALEIAAFYEGFLTERDGQGRVEIIPSLSPENMALVKADEPGMASINATMDVALVRELLGQLCAACELLGEYEADCGRWRELIEALPEYEVDEQGAMREWLHADYGENHDHRHLSHLYPAFPGYEINRDHRPDLLAACGVAVQKRLGIGLESQTGWSLAQLAGAAARLGDGDLAEHCLKMLLRHTTGDNLLTYHNDWRGQGVTLFWGHRVRPPFQIDANLGLVSAVLEMLVQSRPGVVELLPALPEAWEAGRICGVHCRGGVVVEQLSWRQGNRVEAALRSARAQSIRLRLPRAVGQIEAGHAVRDADANVLALQLPAGETVHLAVTLADR